MAEVAEPTISTAEAAGRALCGIAVARHGYGRPTRVVTMIEAGHPVPDAAGLEAPCARSSSPTAPAPTIWCWC